MLFIEAFMIGVKPILISIPFNILFVLFMVNESGLNMSEFMPQSPIVPTIAFVLILLTAIGISYFMGFKQLMQNDLADGIKDDLLQNFIVNEIILCINPNLDLQCHRYLLHQHRIQNFSPFINQQTFIYGFHLVVDFLLILHGKSHVLSNLLSYKLIILNKITDYYLQQ